MKHYLAKHIPLLLALSLSAPFVSAQEEPVYGRQLMTEQERAEHREKMRSLKTEQAREQYRREHHEKMQQRAKERGVSLPEEPGQRGKGINQGKGKGQGMGGGKGPGKGQGQDKNKDRGY